MRQLYIIGSLVAVLVIVLFGLSKLAGTPTNDGYSAADDLIVTEQSHETTMDDTTPPASTAPLTYTRATLKTNKGDVVLELFEDMPITAGNFAKLASEDFYDGVKFHRVIDGFMVQAGDPLSKDDSMQARWGTGDPGYAIQDEFVEGRSNVRGTISMANSGPNSGGSQFFINLVDNTNLDFDKQPLTSKHPVFGRVVEGMDVVDAIGAVETVPGDRPVEPVVIEDVVLE